MSLRKHPGVDPPDGFLDKYRKTEHYGWLYLIFFWPAKRIAEEYGTTVKAVRQHVRGINVKPTRCPAGFDEDRPWLLDDCFKKGWIDETLYLRLRDILNSAGE